jgi:hypothetical protein
MDDAKKVGLVKSRAELPMLEKDSTPLTGKQQFWRRLATRLAPNVIK